MKKITIVSPRDAVAAEAIEGFVASLPFVLFASVRVAGPGSFAIVVGVEKILESSSVAERAVRDKAETFLRFLQVGGHEDGGRILSVTTYRGIAGAASRRTQVAEQGNTP